MKKFFKACLISGFLVLLGITFASCGVDITLQENKDGSVDVKFFAGAGEAFTNLFLSASSDRDTDLIDAKQVEFELAKAGFSKVKVDIANKTDVTLTMTDSDKSSYLFTTGVISSKGGKLSADINPEKMESFYKSSDESTQMLMDLLMGPVFTGDKMTSAEYVEMIGSIYGDAAAKEVESSVLNIVLISADGKKTTKKMPLVDLMTLNGELKIN